VQVKQHADALVKEYFRPSSAACTDAGFTFSSCSDSAAAGVSHVPEKHQLVYQLNKSGRYLELKESLKQAVLQIIAERYKAEDLKGADQVRQNTSV
jgi:hypothetical protein